MTRIRTVVMVLGVAAYTVLWIGGVISTTLWDEVPQGTEWAAPAFLYIASGLVLQRLGWRGRITLFMVGVYGFVAEVFGESTGLIFGDYRYTDKLGPALWNVPAALFSAWVVVTVVATNVLMRLGLRHRWWIVVGPLVMVGVDLLLEPVAVGPMNAWVWESDGSYYGVPAMNFVGWFVVSVPIFALLSAARFHDTNGAVVSTSVIGFFLMLSVTNLLLWPVLIAAVVIVSSLVLRTGFSRRLMTGEGAPLTR